MKIKIRIESEEFTASLLDTPTGKAVYDSLPIKGNISTWGDEIYFGTSVNADLEPGAQAAVAVGDLAFWPPMSAFCIFFGPTPASSDDLPAAASEVNVFGRLDETDPVKLRLFSSGEMVVVEKMD